MEKAADEAGYDFSGVDKPKNNEDLYGLRYAEFVVPLVKAVQELNAKIDLQNKTNQELKNTIEQLKQQNAELMERVERLEEK